MAIVFAVIVQIMRFSKNKTLLSICFLLLTAYGGNIWFVSLDYRIVHYGHPLNAGWSILMMVSNASYLLSHWIFSTMYLRLAKLVISQKVISKRDNRCIDIFVIAVSALIVLNSVVQGLACGYCTKRDCDGNVPKYIHITEHTTAAIFDFILLFIVIIITVALVGIWRAKLFKNVRGMRANRCSMILHISLLFCMVLVKCMDTFLTCSFYSDFIYHLASFSLTILICYVLLMTNRPPKTLKSTPIQSVDFNEKIVHNKSSERRTKSEGEIMDANFDKAYYLG